jgi:hypothetical protein
MRFCAHLLRRIQNDYSKSSLKRLEHHFADHFTDLADSDCAFFRLNQFNVRVAFCFDQTAGTTAAKSAALRRLALQISAIDYGPDSHASGTAAACIVFHWRKAIQPLGEQERKSAFPDTQRPCKYHGMWNAVLFD